MLVGIADDDAHLRDIFELDSATNDRLLAENDLLPGIGIDELVFAVPRYRAINAAFCHAHPSGSRFNGPDRGAWYASFELQTAQAEAAFHKSIALAEIDEFHDFMTYDEYLAGFPPSSTISVMRRSSKLAWHQTATSPRSCSRRTFWTAGRPESLTERAPRRRDQSRCASGRRWSAT